MSEEKHQPLVCTKEAEQLSKNFTEWLCWTDYKFSMTELKWMNRLTDTEVDFSDIYNEYLKNCVTNKNDVLKLKIKSI